MHKVETLNEITHLVESRFGRPRPRHGLKLLYWFANECVSFDQCTLQCDPESRAFGFHSFGNRYDRNHVKLLPEVNFPYYVVGNLNSPGADELPDYVAEDYTGHPDDSNMDRIIVSISDHEWIDNVIEKVYVTEHDDQKHYNAQATYRISKGLLKLIRNLELQSFLEQTEYSNIYIQNAILNFPVIALHQGWTGPKILTGHFEPRPAHQAVVCADGIPRRPKNTWPAQNYHRPTGPGTPDGQSSTALRSEIQDYHIEIEPTTDNDFDYGRRSRCCECTIL